MRKPAHRRAKLTDNIVAALKSGERVYDTNVPGFFVERGPAETSRASFRVLADMPARKRTMSTPKTLFRTIGRAGTGPNEYSAKAARTEAQRLIASIKSGVDPRAPQRGPEGPTLQEAWDDFRNDYLAKKDRSPTTVEYYNYCFARLGKWQSKPLALIAGDPAAIRKMHDGLTKTSGPRAANASLHFTGLLVRHVRGQYPDMPQWPENAYVPNEGAEDMSQRGMGPDELGGWWETVRGIGDPIRRELMLFTLLSGLRSKDARTSRGEHLNEAERTLFVPAPKGHRPNNPKRQRAFYLPLTDAMLGCIRRARQSWLDAKHDPSPYLFPSARNSGRPFTESRTKAKAKFGHDLRRSFATCAEVAGLVEAEYGILLNHKSGSVTGKYPNRTKLHERKLAMITQINDVMVQALGL